MTTITPILGSLYKSTASAYNDCIMEEIKNNNEQALLKYDKLIGQVNEQLAHLKVQAKNFDNLDGTNKLALGKVMDIKAKAITRKSSLEKRTSTNESYTVSKNKRMEASSYSGFASAFKAPASSMSKVEFKAPAQPTAQKNHSNLASKVNSAHVRKSLDLPRPRSSLENSKPRHSIETPRARTREERPKSIDLSAVNQAALLAWDPKPRVVSPPSGAARSSPALTRENSTRKKYEYVKPQINTQITLTQVKRPSTKSRISSSGKSPQLVSDGFSSVKQEMPRKTTTKKYSDPRISKMMSELSGVDKNAVEQILDEIMVTDGKLQWDDLAGLTQAKKSLKETVVYPFLRPDLFKGLREPITGMLLFGPPGTGKTMIAKTVANESNSTFFSISASSLLSKYLGESEKLIRALFYVAKALSPSIIFFDEIDSLLTSRTEGEQESSRRVKTEFLIQWSSLSSAVSNSESKEDIPRVLVLAATNLPWAIDEAARRRFSRRLYIPLPEFDTRLHQLKNLMNHVNHSLSESDFILIANMTEGYSNSDLTSLAKEAAMEPIRDLGEGLINVGDNMDIRRVSVSDFEKAMETIKRSVGSDTIGRFAQWAARYGSTGA